MNLLLKFFLVRNFPVGEALGLFDIVLPVPGRNRYPVRRVRRACDFPQKGTLSCIISLHLLNNNQLIQKVMKRIAMFAAAGLVTLAAGQENVSLYTINGTVSDAAVFTSMTFLCLMTSSSNPSLFSVVRNSSIYHGRSW